MNWHQIAVQAVATFISTGLVGIIATYFVNAALKRIEDSNARQLESFRDALNQKRDSRLALIGQSNYATQKALEIEFNSHALDRRV